MAFSGTDDPELTARQQMRVEALENALSFHLYSDDVEDVTTDKVLQTATIFETYLREGT